MNGGIKGIVVMERVSCGPSCSKISVKSSVESKTGLVSDSSNGSAEGSIDSDCAV